MTAAAKRIKPTWPPEIRETKTSTIDADINALAHTSAVAVKAGVYWIEGVQVRLRAGQTLYLPRDAYVAYKGEDYKREYIN